MADFTGPIRELNKWARAWRCDAAYYRSKGASEDVARLERDASVYEQAAAVLEAAGEISAEGWAEAVDSINVLTYGGEVTTKFRALRDAVEGKP